jgi:hypothetical protein
VLAPGLLSPTGSFPVTRIRPLPSQIHGPGATFSGGAPDSVGPLGQTRLPYIPSATDAKREAGSYGAGPVSHAQMFDAHAAFYRHDPNSAHVANKVQNVGCHLNTEIPDVTLRRQMLYSIVVSNPNSAGI